MNSKRVLVVHQQQIPQNQNSFSNTSQGANNLTASNSNAIISNSNVNHNLLSTNIQQNGVLLTNNTNNSINSNGLILPTQQQLTLNQANIGVTHAPIHSQYTGGSFGGLNNIENSVNFTLQSLIFQNGSSINSPNM